MNFLYPTRALALLSSLFSTRNENEYSQSLIKDEEVVYVGKTMRVIVSEFPLKAGSVKIEPNTNLSNFTEWQVDSQKEAYELIQKIIQYWQQKGISDYLIYGKETNSKSIFSWEITPYPKNGCRLWKQVKVLWNITFGGSRLSEVERGKIAEDFQKAKNLFLEPLTKQMEAVKNIAQGNDAFCNQKIIDKQLIYEGNEINVLYNYAPLVIGKGKLHFLIVPKHHHSKFSDLTETEYLESMQLSQKLVSFYKDKGYHTAYLFDKTGAEAGQTVPHWHEHVVLTATKTQEFFGKLTVLKNMLIGSSPLPQEELQTRVQSLKKELNEALNN